MKIPQKIDSFQLENLINQKIPFIFFTDIKDIHLHYPRHHEHYLKNITTPAKVTMILKELKKRNAPFHSPIVLLYKNRLKSVFSALQLSFVGYHNAFYVTNGPHLDFTPKKN